MAVITISRESGSGGGLIAQMLARSMGWHLVDGAVLKAVLEQYGVVDFDEVYDAPAGLTARFASRRGEMTDLLNRILRAFAQHGDVVILGRGGYGALRNRADVLNVRVQAPMPVRAARILERGQAQDLEAAQKLATDQDGRRATFVKLSYSLAWDSAHDFDLVVDTGKLSADTCCALLARAAMALRAEPGAASPAEPEVDDVLLRAVSDVLQCERVHAAPGAAPAGTEVQPIA